ncbi:hypothetical protein CY35_16G020200 [Sphagnum magellanicum]|nr:hypothetical protein CY35_16G020200 [Sphagnum magellanicum]KAH9536821.1 hypothetical protein CY35_16G020200 [Sphagnum magellanicum]KAH9536822.1 hypothetical protein CY35_16G020200 [Sphagnum magellanicum]KAH9536823.1 hypothetical protein CY35_16G020200 [Sphagnum magellanicum]KAH9536824.1 hypothetical protein CY35_16G020200 [Sphagnum magellanicum]
MEGPEKTGSIQRMQKLEDVNIEDTNIMDISAGVGNLEDPKVDETKQEDVKIDDMNVDDAKLEDGKMDDESDNSPIEETTIGECTDKIIRERVKERNGVKRERNARWTEVETLTLIAARHAESQKHLNSKCGDLSYQRKWVAMAERCKAAGMQRSPRQLKKRWNSLHSNYVHIKEWHSRPGAPNFWAMDRKDRMIHKLPAYFNVVLYKALEHPSSIVLPRTVTPSSNLVTSAGEDAVDSSEDNGRSTFPVIKFHASSSIPSPLPLLPPLPSTSLSLPLPQLQVPSPFRPLSQPPRIPGYVPSSAPIQQEDLKKVWLETFLLGFSVDPKVIEALDLEEVTVEVLLDEGTEDGVYKVLKMVAEATGVNITVGQQARVWHAVRQWRDEKLKA